MTKTNDKGTHARKSKKNAVAPELPDATPKQAREALPILSEEGEAREGIDSLIEILTKDPKQLAQEIKHLIYERADTPASASNLTSVSASEPSASTSEGVGSPGTEGEVGKAVVSPGEKSPVVVPTIPRPVLKKQEKYLTTLRRSGNKTRAAASVGGTLSMVKYWRTAYPQFRAVEQVVLDMLVDDLEEECRRRAFRGILKPVGWYKGEAGAMIREYSDLLLIFLLKGLKPETYRDAGVQGSGPIGVQVVVSDYSHVTVVSDKKGYVNSDVIDVTPVVETPTGSGDADVGVGDEGGQ